MSERRPQARWSIRGPHPATSTRPLPPSEGLQVDQRCALCGHAEFEVLLYGTSDGARNRVSPQRLEHVEIQFPAFFVDKVCLPAELLATEPQDPIPEMSVNPRTA